MPVVCVPALVDFKKLSDSRRGESSETIRARVEKALRKQRGRFAGLNNGVMTNANMTSLTFVSFVNWMLQGSNSSRLQ
jgi:predicted ATPase with chaperone activity